MSFASRIGRVGGEMAEMLQVRKFGWNDDMVTDSSAEKAKLYRTDAGLQVVVEFDRTSYSESYDRAVDALRRYARSGSENMGWVNEKYKQDPQGNLNKWGQKHSVEVNGRKYYVVEETQPGPLDLPCVSIQGAYNLKTDALESPETGYYLFSGGERKLDICGAHMPLDEVKSDIMKIINIASNTRV